MKIKMMFAALSLFAIVGCQSSDSASNDGQSPSTVDPTAAKQEAKQGAVSGGVSSGVILDGAFGDAQSKIVGDVIQSAITAYADSALPNYFGTKSVNLQSSSVSITGTTEKSLDSNMVTIYNNYDLVIEFNDLHHTKDTVEYRIWGKFKYDGYKWEGNTDSLEKLYGTSSSGGVLLYDGVNGYSSTFASTLNANFPPYAPARSCTLSYTMNSVQVVSDHCTDYRYQ